MRLLFLFLTLLIGSTFIPAHAQSTSEMDLQRCIWACLANSKGNDDPAYHTCVKEYCVATEQTSEDPIPRQSKPADTQTILFVQKSLAALGFDPGPADGVFGRKTAAAIKAFQRARGLSQSGVIDDGVVSALRSSGEPGQAETRPANTGSAGADLDVAIIEYGGDGQAATCASSVVAGLNSKGDGFLAVRSGPGPDYRKIDELHNGDVVYAFDQKGDWVGVAYNDASIDCASQTTRPVQSDYQGWVHRKWLNDLAG
ncbi:MAG: peptidoglycan-binding protein [Roseibium sp.]|uniref:peptidoglycan-binding protein n=1 Tax=Roseibium sp. TaxID=1936156 RepID=UPI0026077EE5|nr:peptidoglycan-binding protein [Roseibium sp.]MCV0429452.1 peptidoglycan-binding protein [Roseibium sp.]